jgi:PDZ domain
VRLGARFAEGLLPKNARIAGPVQSTLGALGACSGIEVTRDMTKRVVPAGETVEFSIRARLPLASVWLALVLTAPAFADEAPFGSLGFSRLSKPQEDFFWKRLKSLAIEEAILTYCGQSDDFARAAKQGIRACVTSEALNRAESFFDSELKTAQNDLRGRWASCRAKPEATRGWLGVELKSVGKEEADARTPSGKGALVTGALEDSPAANAQLKPGDIIEAVNGQPIAAPKDLSTTIRGFSPGATVQLDVSRDGVERTISVKLGAMAFDQDGRTALDMPALVASSKQDLKYVADEVTAMCLKCKTSIWAVFCR